MKYCGRWRLQTMNIKLMSFGVVVIAAAAVSFFRCSSRISVHTLTHTHIGQMTLQKNNLIK